MKIALVHNVSNFASSLAPWLRIWGAGNDVTVFSSKSPLLDDADVLTSVKGEDVFTRQVRKVLMRYYKRQKWDFWLNYAHPTTGFNGPEIMYWQGAELFWGADEWMGRKANLRGYYCTPDIKRFLSQDSILLPRACNVSRFAGRYEEIPNDRKQIVIGHFWRRGSLTDSYYNRYWKKTDLLFDAISILQARGYKIVLHNGPIAREIIPDVLKGLDVFVDEFCGLSHSMTAIESLLTGTPVVGTYDPALCECKEALDLLTNTAPDPELIADAILRNKSKRVPKSNAIYEYYHPKHAAKILMETWQKFV